MCVVVKGGASFVAEDGTVIFIGKYHLTKLTQKTELCQKIEDGSIEMKGFPAPAGGARRTTEGPVGGAAAALAALTAAAAATPRLWGTAAFVARIERAARAERQATDGADRDGGLRRAVEARQGAATAEGTPAKGTPAEGTPAEGTPAAGTPAEGTPTHVYKII